MDILAEKFNDLDRYLNSLEDEDIAYFNEFSRENIEKINELIKEMESMLSKLKPSEEKLKLIDIENKKQKIISNKLFSAFWAIRESINGMNSEELERV